MKQYNRLMEESTKPCEFNNYTNHRLYIIENAFTREECEKAVKSFEKYPCEKGLVGDPVDNDPDGAYTLRERPVLRDCYVTYAEREEHNLWLHRRLERLMQDANDRFWKFDITDYSQPLRMMTYHAGNHFGSLHADHGPKETCFRKLTAILQASDPDTYEGGDFEMPGEPIPPEARKQGSVLIFPAYLIHRVTPVTKGTRHSIIHRAIGPWFR